VEAARTLARFGAMAPRRYEAVSSVVTEHRGQAMTAVGAVSVDVAARRFALTAVSPMGLRLFDIVSEGESLVWGAALPGVKDAVKFTRALADDLRRAYFDPLPEGVAAAWREEDRIVFSSPSPDGRVEHVFEQDRLVEKRHFRGRRLVVRVEFSNYEERDGRLYARLIGVTNAKLGYRLTARVKELHPGDGASESPR
jgi:hypothetical protein